MRTTLLCVLQLLVIAATAQRECASTDYIKEQRSLQKQAISTYEQVEAFIQQQQLFSAPSLSKESGNISSIDVIRIPVVVHVIYNNEVQNISEAQIKSQIDALNKDFRKKNADTSITPDRFKPFAADVAIEFFLATADPKGRPTNGIVRRQSSVTEWTMDDQIKFKDKGGDNAWDSKSYLNIWVGPLRKLLGYASEPGGPADKDGIVINTTAFGTIGTSAPFHLGRTAVHEVGHWLGLKHIWGDSYCGDDLVDDTPKQSNYSVGCPTGIRISCANDPLGNMYMNFMDFTNDACMSLFTVGQKNRIRALFNPGGPRYSLTLSKGLNEPWSNEIEIEETFVTKEPTVKSGIYPNPAQEEVVITLSDDKWIGKDIQLVNLNGIPVRSFRITSTIQRLPLNGLVKGIYFIKGDLFGNAINYKLIKL